MESLRARLMVLVALACLPVIGLVLFEAAQERREAMTRAQDETRRIVRLSASNCEHAIESARQLLTTIAEAPVVQSREPGATSLFFEQLLHRFPHYVYLAAAGIEGDVIASGVPLDWPDNVTETAFFQRAFVTRGFTLGSAEPDATGSRRALSVAYPLLDNDGEVALILFADIELRWFDNLGAGLNLPARTAFYAADENGTILARFPEPERWRGKSLADVPVGRAIFGDRSRSGGSIEARGVDGVTRLHVFQWVKPGGGGNGNSNSGSILVGAGIPRETIFLEAGRALRRKLLLVAVLAGIAFAAAWILSDRLVLHWVRPLVAATRRVAGGEIDARVDPIGGGRELEELARSFNDMSRSLERRFAERRAIRHTLQESAKLFHTLFDFSPTAIFVEDEKGDVLNANAAACRLHGRERAALIGRNVTELVPESRREEVAKVFSQWFDGSLHYLEGESIRDDGRRVPVEIRGCRIDYAGRPAVLLHVTDMTERKRHEAELHEAQEQLEARVEKRTAELAAANRRLEQEVAERRAAEETLRELHKFLDSIVENIPDMVFVKDARELRFVRLNKAGEELLGFSSAELIGRNDHDFFPKEEADFFIGKDRAVLKGGTLLDIPQEEILTRRKGRRILHTKKIPIPDATGQPQYLLGISEDITERIEAHRKLEQTTEELRRSNRELEQFAYVASHDLQEPLRMVASYTRLLQKRYAAQLDATANEFIAHALDGATRMQAFIRDLLHYSRVGSRSRPFERVDLAETVRIATQNLKVAIEEAHAVVKWEALPAIQGDPQHMVQLFQNLIGNALKFRKPEVPPEVRISATRREKKPDESEQRWEIAVADNGIGIPADAYERIFILFQRLHGREEYEGTGIGLAICKKLVERQGGRIWVESRPGEGSSFHFTLPEAGSPV